MEKSDQAFVYSARTRRRTIRVFRINRIVALIVLAGIVLSGVITYFVVSAGKRQGIEGRSFYFIELGQFTSSGDALTKSIEIRNGGGAGYVINDGIFRVMATVFSDRNNAEIVRVKLASSGIACSIYEVKTVELKAGEYDSKEELAKVRELVLYPIEGLFSGFSSLDISLDSGEITDRAALLAAANLGRELAKRHEEIVALLGKHPADSTLNRAERIYKQITKAISDYLPQGELTIENNLKSILCAIVEINISEF